MRCIYRQLLNLSNAVYTFYVQTKASYLLTYLLSYLKPL